MTIADDRRTTADFSLRDRYTAEDGQILATGIQALVRLPIDLMRGDRRAGHRTAAFIAGYQGSPLGGYDRELASQADILGALDIVHRPAVNEELGATAVMGSQLSMTFASHSYDGVAGIWYGKSPGLDRAGDAIRHGNYAGTGRLSGVLALVGDDPACKSSTLPSRSDVTLAGLDLPIVYPGTIQDVIDLGLHGFALVAGIGLVGVDEDRHVRRRRLRPGDGRARPRATDDPDHRGRRWRVATDAHVPHRSRRTPSSSSRSSPATGGR